MDARKLYRSEATPSMFVYCVRRLHFSEEADQNVLMRSPEVAADASSRRRR
jgi:hypothetical protein